MLSVLSFHLSHSASLCISSKHSKHFSASAPLPFTCTGFPFECTVFHQFFFVFISLWATNNSPGEITTKEQRERERERQRKKERKKERESRNTENRWVQVSVLIMMPNKETPTTTTQYRWEYIIEFSDTHTTHTTHTTTGVTYLWFKPREANYGKTIQKPLNKIENKPQLKATMIIS